ncbi:hypothetical protein E9993_19635 [Labilibacter sediminis]|nr:hypothetical protein E9993_19635 [Labilibacter sediminis]
MKYNAVASSIMKKYGVIIDDQYGLTSKYPEEQREANVHFYEEGKKRQAHQVSQNILDVLGL